MKKKDIKKDDTGFSLFPDIIPQSQTPKDKFIRDELNIAEFPFALFGKKRPKDPYKRLFPLDSNTSISVVGNKEEGVEIIYAGDLDYLYGLMDMLFEQTRYQDETIYFTVNQLIIKAGKAHNQEEYTRALRILKKLRWVIIKTTAFRTVDEKSKEVKQITENLSILQNFTVIGGVLKRGRRQPLEESTHGYCKVEFSKFFLRNLQSEEMSTPLNLSFMMKLSTPLARRYFRMINSWKNREPNASESCIISRDLRDIARRIPLSDSHNPSVIMRRLNPVHEELKALKFLSEVKYIPGHNGSYNVSYVFSKYSVEQACALFELTKRGISSVIAENVIAEQALDFIMDVIKYYDIRSKTQNLQPGYIISTLRDATPESIKKFLDNHFQSERIEKEKARASERETLKMVYEQDVQQSLEEAFDALSEKDRSSLLDEADTQTPQYGSVRSRKLAVEATALLTLKTKMDIPSFEEWYDKRKNLLTR